MTSYQDWQKRYPDKATLLKPYVAAIRQVVPDAEVILYGSIVRGDSRADSDVDLLVLVAQETTPKLKRAISDRIYAVELERSQIASVMVRQRAEWDSEPLSIMPLHRAIEREGVRV